MRLLGKVSIWKNGELLVEDENTINNGLKQYFKDLMDSPTDKALDNLFTADGEIGGGTQDGMDGIFIRTSIDNNNKSMITTDEGGGGTVRSRKFRGEYTNNTGAAEDAEFFAIGWNFTGTFSARFATYNPADITLQDQDTIVLEWELRISS